MSLSNRSAEHVLRCGNCKSGVDFLLSVLQVLYLVLVQLMDTRGNQLEPPPPEAFEQGFLHVSSLMK